MIITNPTFVVAQLQAVAEVVAEDLRVGVVPVTFAGSAALGRLTDAE
jgi:hypothetical protein